MSDTAAISFESFVRNLVRESVRDVLREESLDRRNAAPAEQMGEYISVAKAARLADVASGTIRTWIRKGRLTPKRAGRVLRIKRSELEDFLCGKATGPRGDAIRHHAAQLLSQQKMLRSRSV